MSIEVLLGTVPRCYSDYFHTLSVFHIMMYVIAASFFRWFQIG